MSQPAFTKQFAKDVALAKRRGKDTGKLKAVIGTLLTGEALSPVYRDHKLVGDYIGRRECHIDPDWLLIYKVVPGVMIFERTGIHLDLF